jgi:elongation factor Ts
MAITAETVKQLRERTGAGMMECKRALTETNGDLDAAAELMRKAGLAKADKKAARVAAEGTLVIERGADGRSAVMVEVNCETDFVAREQDFRAFAADVARAALAARSTDVAVIGAQQAPGSGETVEERRRALVARIGENITVRRATFLEAPTVLGAYVHGTRIATLVALKGGDEPLARDLAMHVAASNPRYIEPADVPADVVAKEREILVAQAAQDEKNKGKPVEILARISEGRVRKFLDEICLVGQPFVKDPDTSVEKLLKAADARVTGFVRFEVGEGIEKKQENFADEVMAQVKAAEGRH